MEVYLDRKQRCNQIVKLNFCLCNSINLENKIHFFARSKALNFAHTFSCSHLSFISRSHITVHIALLFLKQKSLVAKEWKSSQMLISSIEWSFVITSSILHILLPKLLEVQSLLIKTLSTSQSKHKNN